MKKLNPITADEQELAVLLAQEMKKHSPKAQLIMRGAIIAIATMGDLYSDKGRKNGTNTFYTGVEA